MELSNDQRAVAVQAEADLKRSIDAATTGTLLHTFLITTLWELQDLASPSLAALAPVA